MNLARDLFINFEERESMPPRTKIILGKLIEKMKNEPAPDTQTIEQLEQRFKMME